MAKPIWAGKGENEFKGKFNSALDRSWLVTWEEDDEGGTTTFENQGGGEDGEFTDSNDFFYLAAGQGWDYEGDTALIVPEIDGLGGADQLILQEDATILDGFFANIENITVLKLFDGKGAEDDYEFAGSQVTLAEEAQEAGIREVTGGPGDDVIDFSGYKLESESNDDSEDEVADPLEIIIKGGAGADEMTASVGNDTFIWKAGDMEGTNGDHAGFETDGYIGSLFDVIINFNTDGEDVLDISELLIGFDCTFGEAETDQERLDYLTDWVVFEDETLYVDIDGAGEDHDSEALVSLQGVTEFDLLTDLTVC